MFLGSNMLNQLKHDVNKENIGLYSDHGLGGFSSEKKKKETNS